jgi:anti-anti-sigma regulatory factor
LITTLRDGLRFGEVPIRLFLEGRAEGSSSGGKFDPTSPEATENEVEAFAGEMRTLLGKQPRDLTIDVSKVQNITIPALQLIVAVEKTMTAAGGTLTLCGDSPIYNAACIDSGLLSLLTVEAANG